MLNRFFCLVFLLLTSSAWASLASETNAEGRIEWSADYSAWGERQHSLPLDADEAAQIHTDCALRFQGQYFDVETGLHYNTLRCYNPGCGRFISPDPINIQGGLNLYQYAPNAANWIDPFGWACSPQQLAKNRIAGAQHEANTTAALKAKYGADNVQEQILVRPLDVNGNPVSYRVRLDNVVTGKNTRLD